MKRISGGFNDLQRESYPDIKYNIPNLNRLSRLKTKTRRGLGRVAKKGYRAGKKGIRSLFSMKSFIFVIVLFSLIGVFFSIAFFGSGESDGKSQSYIDNGNISDTSGVVQYSNANANCKAYYQTLARTTILQEVEENGQKVIIDRFDERYKTDFFHRDKDFYINPDLLYCLNKYVFGDDFVYPEAFCKPVAYDKDTYEVIDLVSDGNLNVTSEIRDEYGQPTGEFIQSVSDYGLCTVCTYTTFDEVTSLQGTYISEDYFDEETGTIKQREISEPFYVELDRSTHDILDIVVTYSGTINYEYSEVTSLKEAFEVGASSDNAADNVEKIKYDTIVVEQYVAYSNFSADLEPIYCYKDEIEDFKTYCDEIDYSIATDENGEYLILSNSYDLYKYRNEESGIYKSSVTPLGSSVSEEQNNEYLYDYLSRFDTYRPLIERSYETFRNMTSQANISTYEGYTQNVSSGTGSVTDDVIINELGEAAAIDMSESGILASFTVAQALLESGYGNGNYSDLAAIHNNWFGIKAGSSWDGPTVVYSTREENPDGTSYYVDATWCVFEDRISCLQYHSRFLWNTTGPNGYRYRDCAGLTDYSEICAVLKEGGYFTANLEDYTNGIISLVERYDLTRFDTGVWDGTPPSYATEGGVADSYDSVTLTASTTLNEEDKATFYAFFHATDNIYDGDTLFEEYYCQLSSSDVDKMLRLANSYINGTTLTDEGMYNSENLWTYGYLTDLSNNKRNLNYNGDMADYIIEIALSHVNETHERFTEDFYGYVNPVPWCAVYVWSIYNEADALECIGDTDNDPGHWLEKLDGSGNISAPTPRARSYYEWGIANNRLVELDEGMKGDIVVFCWNEEGCYEDCVCHVGLIVENNGDGTYVTVEGNTGDGFCLKREDRSIANIRAIIRPNY